jgi:hypothetical protein
MRPRFIGNIARALAGAVRTKRVVHVFQAIFAEACNDRRVTFR